MNPINWTLSLPEIVLAVSVLVLLVCGVLPKRDTSFAVTMGGVGALLVTAALVLGQAAGSSVLGTVITSAGYTTAFLVAVTFSALAIIPATRHTVRPAATVQEVGV